MMSAPVKPEPGMIVTKDITLEPGDYDFSSGKGIAVGADGITIDGNGAVLHGPGKKGNKHSFHGIGLYSNGYSRITIKNLSINGFLTGCKVLFGQRINILNNDFSDNFTDPDYGWGDGESHGALILEEVSDSTIEDNTGNHVWNGMDMMNCDGNRISRNRFSHCSNTCLRLWHSRRNVFHENIMNYGIRIVPGEVHARDSTSALIETGSNNNQFYKNDFTYGGDGVFIRSLNGYISTGNHFEENDASYAHNNAWEVWDPGNTFINNTGNHSSYGYWLGGSDHTVFIGNEAAYNGIRRSNAPEAFGNAGVAVVNGSSNHFVMSNNHIHHNKSVGAAIRFKEKDPAYHWVIQKNRITDNETYGIYLKNAEWVNLSGNQFGNNKSGDVKEDGNTRNICKLEASAEDPVPEVEAKISADEVYAGEKVQFDAVIRENVQSEETLFYRWELGDGTVAETRKVEHQFRSPGFYRAGLTVNNGKTADLDFLDLYVLNKGEEIGTEIASADDWEASGFSKDDFIQKTLDRKVKIQGETSLKVRSNAKLAKWHYPAAKNGSWMLKGRERFSFWMKMQHETRDGFIKFQNPIVTLAEDEEHYIQWIPRKLDLTWPNLHSEARYGWIYVDIPIQGDDLWLRKSVGEPVEKMRYIQMEIRSEGGYYNVWIDGLQVH